MNLKNLTNQKTANKLKGNNEWRRIKGSGRLLKILSHHIQDIDGYNKKKCILNSQILFCDEVK